MSPTYASETQVTSDRSIAEIKRTVQRYGADQFAFMEGTSSAAVAFVIGGRQVRFDLAMPSKDAPEFGLTPTGKPRSDSSTASAYEQAVRQQWRALALVVKAKLEAVELALAGHDAPMLAITSGGKS